MDKWRAVDGLVGEGDQVLLAFDAGVQTGADAPDTGGVAGVGTGCDEKTVHGPVVIWAEGQAVVGLVVPADAKGNDVGDLSMNGSGIVAASLALFVFVMEKIWAKALGQDVSKLAVQKKRLLLPCFLARLAREIRNPLSSLDTHAELLEGGLAEPGPQAKEKLVGRLEMIQGEVHPLENISQQFLRLWMAQQIVAPHGGSIQTANAPGGGAVFSVRLLL
jgi:K+-sensing histidine kinase KdpD